MIPLNCKQGDLAIIVHSEAGNEGKIVQCVEYLGIYKVHRRDKTVFESPVWKIDREIIDIDGATQDICCDSYLRPIRDDLLEEEDIIEATLLESQNG